MDIKKIIKKEFGNIISFARLLNAPASTMYSWTRAKHRRVPAKWLVEALLDCAEYRQKQQQGWKMRKNEKENDETK